jgi:hypothetical protein
MRMRVGVVCRAVGLGCVVGALVACTNPQIGGIDQYVATTPQTFAEARAFYLGEPVKAGGGCNPGASADLRPLLRAYEANAAVWASIQAQATAGAATGPQDGAGDGARKALVQQELTRRKFVRHNEPLSVIVNKVVTPAGAGTRDVAVVLDILTRGDQRVKPLVVWYQRDVPGGKELGFENLLVYFDAAWDSKIPPYFRLRLIDVEAEDNRATRELLEGAGKLAGTFAGVIPHPIMPGVELGLEAAKQILGNSANKVLMDYTVQFYSASDRDKNGGADLGYLTTGHWIAIGLHRSQDAEFWRNPLFFDQRTLRTYSQESTESLLAAERPLPAAPAPGDASAVPTGVTRRQTLRPRLDAPVILMTVSTAESVVPTIVLDRSEELTKYLSDAPSKMNFDAMATSLGSLTSAMNVYIVKRRVEREQTADAMKSLMTLLMRHNQAISQTASDTDRLSKLSDGDVRLLLLTLESQTLLRDKNSVADWVAWWNGKGQQGRYEFDATLDRSVWKAP